MHTLHSGCGLAKCTTLSQVLLAFVSTHSYFRPAHTGGCTDETEYMKQFTDEDFQYSGNGVCVDYCVHS